MIPKVFFIKKKNDQMLDRFEALDLFMRAVELTNAQRYGEAMRLIGMDSDAFTEEQSLDELVGIFAVRMSDLAKQAGIKVTA